MKQCSKCKQLKELAQFHKQPGAPDGRHSWCNDCKNTAHQQWRIDNPEKYKLFSSWEYRKGRDYGISPSHYDFVFFMHHNQCVMSELGNCKGKLGLDHDHQTGEIRGVLCDYHNKALDRFGDNVNAITILEKYFYGDLNASQTPDATGLKESSRV